ncbi:Peroxisomal acyl-coenzyme A oxidase 1 [Smittium mucronatum]|uniref:Acyl-coenzyme A oxidase n=1 Tax=Smittium mucronatum TaxID=133383 RepID=A0A1R0GUZ9_9FUNG|nr:Peroxisomal acyl-coenzyme A oxidase 1 [Smittium mucronatum]
MKFSANLVDSKPHTSDSLEAERKKASFSTDEMMHYILGDKIINSRNRALEIIKSEPELFDQRDIYYLSRTEKLEKSLKQEKTLQEMRRQGKITAQDIAEVLDVLDWTTPFALTRIMFIPTLEQQCNEEQREAFLKPAQDYRIIGCYAQTEVGHGSNIRALETTATFIPETDEFEVNSPTLTSTKWWIGSLGITSTHACVMAQLYVKGKHIGLFPIIVPLRSMVDHKPLPGVNVGDIGPKMGFTTMDNGFLNFDKVRVPRFNLLQKYINVSRDGIVTRPNNIDPRVTYGSMVYVRATIARNMGISLGKAVTIATRYSSVRRQFGEPNQPETPVLDYPIVQYRVIPLLAKAYLMIGMSHEFFAQYQNTTERINQGDFSTLKEMHAISCGLKRWTSDTAVYGVDTCRHVCGGHGFSMFSGLNEFFGDMYQNIIVEGDNYVLAKQTARYLVKSAHDLNSPSTRSSVEVNDTTAVIAKYSLSNELSSDQLFSWRNKSASEIAGSYELLMDLLGYRFVTLVDELGAKIYSGQTWDESSVASQAIATAHAEYITCLYFMRYLSRPANQNIKQILKVLFSVAALSFLTKNTAELFGFQGKAKLEYTQIKELESEYIRYIKMARVQAVPLVDSLGISDIKLNSSLGRHDGNVYEDYIQRALMEPVNVDGSGDKIREHFYNDYIGPILKGYSPSSSPFSKL